jgi:choline kinase
VDIGTYIEESMKVVEENGKLVEISKQVVRESALGCSIDVYKFSAKAGKMFFDKCAEYIEKGDLKKWSEVALNDILKMGDFRACPLVGRWLEIDNHDDLAAAEKLFQ